MLRRARANQGHERRRSSRVDEFPSFPGFSARLFAACRDKELALAVLRAYNDWHIDEWCGSYPGDSSPWPCQSSGIPNSAQKKYAGWRPKAATP